MCIVENWESNVKKGCGKPSYNLLFPGRQMCDNIFASTLIRGLSGRANLFH